MGEPDQHRAALLRALGAAGALALMPGWSAAQYTASTWVHSDAGTSTSYSAMAGDAQSASSDVGNAVAVSTHSANSDNLWHSITAENWSRSSAAVSGGALHLLAVTDAVSASTKTCEGCLGSGGGTTHAAASASFSDLASLSIEGLAAGTRVQATFVVNVDGSLTAGATGNLSGWQVASVNWTFGVKDVRHDAQDGYGYQIWVDNGAIRDNSAALMPEQVILQAVLTTGEDFDIRMAANVSSQAVAQTSINALAVGQTDEGGGAASASFANTFAWGGLIGLTDLEGNALDLSLARISSTSGYDYTQAYVAPIPEPGVSALALGGLVLLPWLRGRRDRRRPAP